MSRPAPRTHWLRENANERSPHRVLIVDAETRPASADDPDRQLLRLWAAQLLRRREVDPGRPRTEWFRGTTAAELAATVDGLARSDRALWVMTHNLSFDLAVTALPVELAALGWRITEAALTTESPWCRMVRGTRRLVLADTWSWLPAGIAEIGGLIGRRKLPLPAWDAPDAAWQRRCDEDVRIAADAIGSVMDWWDAAHVGNWSITGPACGWSSYRHRRPAPRVLIEPDPDARALEMRAVTGGRRQVTRTGELPRGLYADLDIATAHLTAMAALPLPFRRLTRFASLPTDHRALDSMVIGALAECEVDVTAPRYPWDSGRGIFFPIGRFRTVLAGPELREARNRGELRAIGPGYLYQLNAHMADWALWVAGLLDPDQTDVPPAVRLLAKHWSRCVPGKWAGRTSDVIARTADPRPGWSVTRAWLPREHRPAELLQIGGERWTIIRDEWADDAFPAILAWIQSSTRVALGRLVDRLGPALLSCNTDGALVDVRALLARFGEPPERRDRTDRDRLATLALWCDLASLAMAPYTLRIKTAAGRATVISPQHLILGQHRQLAGIPAKAVRLADGRYSFTQWPKLRVQLQRADTRGYSTRAAAVDLSRVAPAGWLLQDGRVLPARVDHGASGPDRLGSPESAGVPRDALAPADRQHAALRPALAATEAAA